MLAGVKKRKFKSVDFNKREWEYFAKCFGFTKREVHIVRLVCQGWENDEIAQGLNIKYKTVVSHLWNICGKMRVSGKVGIILGMLEAWENMPRKK